MKTAVKIFLFTILVSAFYSYVGQMVPQKVTYPPEDLEIGADLTPEQMVEIGQQIVEGKGTCLTCHTVGSHDDALRFPDLDNIGAIAATRVDGVSAEDYLAESLYDPNAFVVEGFLPGMPPIGRPPISLSDEEILTVIAYLQSMGSTPTVTMQTKYAYQSAAAPAGAPPSTPTATAAASGSVDGETVFGSYLCNTCHAIDAPTPLVGPSLYDVGSRMTRAEIYEAVLDPDATIAEGFSPGLMGATLQAVGFTEKISPAEFKALIDFLASKTGN